jgi:hypothetical protein
MIGSAIGTRRRGVQTEERSHALSSYVTAVATIGGALVLHSVAATARMAHPLVWVAIVAPAILVGTFRLNIHSISASISVSDTFWILTALLFGPGPAAVAVAADSLIMSWRRHHEWEHIAFNAAAPAASIWAGAHVFFFVARVPPLLQTPTPITSLILPLLLLSLVDFLCNSAVMAIAIGLEARRSPFDVWRRHFLWLSVSYLPAASVAFCLILMWQQASLVLTRVNMATYSAWSFPPARFILTSQEDEGNAASQPVSNRSVAARASRLGESGAPVYVAIFSSGASAHDPVGGGGARQ